MNGDVLQCGELVTIHGNEPIKIETFKRKMIEYFEPTKREFTARKTKLCLQMTDKQNLRILHNKAPMLLRSYTACKVHIVIRLVSCITIVTMPSSSKQSSRPL